MINSSLIQKNAYYKELSVSECLDMLKNVTPLIASLFLFGIIPMRKELIDNVEVLFKDGDATNAHISNLSYRFKSPIELIPGYFVIPYYTSYLISREGVVFSTLSNQEMTWCVTKKEETGKSIGGYRYNRFEPDSGKSNILFRHRALCLTFKEYPGNVSKLVVNHLNGIPGDDLLDNLEWTTHAKNNQHAYDNELRPIASKPVLVWNLETDTITRYPTASYAARVLGFKKPSLITRRARELNGIVYPDKIWYKFDDGTPWPPKPDLTQIKQDGIARKVVARNIFTKEVVVLNSCASCATVLNISGSTVRTNLMSDVRLPVGGYDFRYLGEKIKWPDYNEYDLAIFKDHPNDPARSKGVIATNDSEELFFTSVVKASHYFNVSKTIIVNTCAKNQTLNGYKLQFYVLSPLL